MDSDLTEYTKARSDLLEEVEREIVGPYFGEKDFLPESPNRIYSAGILFPQNETNSTTGDNPPEEVDLIETTNTIIATDETYENSEPDNVISELNADSFRPSAAGITFSVEESVENIEVTVRYGKYEKCEFTETEFEIDNLPESITSHKEFKQYFNYDGKILKPLSKPDREVIDQLLPIDDNFKGFFFRISKLLNNCIKRTPKEHKVTIDRNHPKEKILEEGLELNILKQHRKNEKIIYYTVAVVNTLTYSERPNDYDCFYQVSIEITSGDIKKDIFTEYTLEKMSADPEECSLQLLYSRKKNFAVGHNCSCKWEVSTQNCGRATKLHTMVIPWYVVPQVTFEIEGLSDSTAKVLLMKNLSDEKQLNDKELIIKLKSFCEGYKNWVGDLSKEAERLEKKLKETSVKHIKECMDVYNRMIEGVKLIERDELIRRSFRLANEAMLLQRVHSGIIKQRRNPNDPIPDCDEKELYRHKWRPFQLAFLLLTIKSMSEPESEERNIVDLIWFPTGGGKTEAYFALSSFTIFLRRLKYPSQSGGTTILMRYTLRLLTAQQFQRASTLICACEQLRKRYSLGKDPITIGLWIGSSSTPNKNEDAVKILTQLKVNRNEKNKFQVLSCPWCGTGMTEEPDVPSSKWGYKKLIKPQRVIFHCPNSNCDFHNELPIKVVDEEIYREPPTLLFGTVDKFAMLPWKCESRNIFALNNNNLAPELIIQDELHLLSGALGSIVGLYETAIQILCSQKGNIPKLIASSATIRRSNEQCINLYNRKVKQFPPPGLDADDSYFARKAEDQTRYPGRLYAGIMPWGKTQTIAEIRTTAKLLQSVMHMQVDDKIKNIYWTLVTYFNSMRELGKFATLAEDDIKSHIGIISRRGVYENKRYITGRHRREELNSRTNAEDIPKILKRLETNYPDDNAISVLSATNMISVGVDVERLGLMMIVGQPKTTSEYIQSSSRVGRSYPGLVLTIYNPARSRDRSHYERFAQYHSALYRYVEPTSVTPFSGPARSRALPAVFVALVRLIMNLPEEDSVIRFDPSAPEIIKLTDEIIERIKDIDPKEAEYAKNELSSYIANWKALINTDNQKITFSGNLIEQLNCTVSKTLFKLPTSMRNVDVGCKLFSTFRYSTNRTDTTNITDTANTTDTTNTEEDNVHAKTDT